MTDAEKLSEAVAKINSKRDKKTGTVAASEKVREKPKSEISDREKNFVALVLAGKSVVAAAIEAGYKTSVANSRCHEWLTDERDDSTKPALWDYWQKRRDKLLRKWDVTPENIVRELQLIASSNLSNFVELHSSEEIENPNQTDPEKIFLRLSGRTLRIKSFREIPADLLPSIESISEDKHGVKIKLWNKLQAIDMLARIGRMYETKTATPDDDDKPATEINLVVHGIKSPLMQNHAKQDQAGVSDATVEN